MNQNLQFSFHLVDFFFHQGIRNFFFSPGARNSPLIYALNQKKSQANISLISHFDERALGFLALGHIKKTGEKAVIISTSGSAVANFYPAVLDASYNSYPLIVITADRPSELHGLGNNQTIEQNNFYQSYSKAFLNFSLKGNLNLNFNLRLINYRLYDILYKSTTGPTHINIEFTEPLIETLPDIDLNQEQDSTADSTTKRFDTFKIIDPKTIGPTKQELENYLGEREEFKTIFEKINSEQTPLIIFGKLAPFEEKSHLIHFIEKLVGQKSAKQKLAKQKGTASLPVIVLDIASNLIDKLSASKLENCVIDFPDLFFQHLEFNLDLKNLLSKKIDYVIHFGGAVISKNLLSWLNKWINNWLDNCPRETDLDYYHIDKSTLPYNPTLTITSKLNISADSFAQGYLYYSDRLKNGLEKTDGLEKTSPLEIYSKGPASSKASNEASSKTPNSFIKVWNAKIKTLLDQHFAHYSNSNASINELDELETCRYIAQCVFNGVNHTTNNAINKKEKKKINLILGNSTVIRNFNSLITKEWSQEWATSNSAISIDVIVNRGTSGIEGFIATSVGAHLASQAKIRGVAHQGETWLILGDMSFLYDLSSLALIEQHKINKLKIIVLNNGEGTIFRHLPINNFFSEAERKIAYYQHDFSFLGTAQQFSLNYKKASSTSGRQALKQLLTDLAQESKPSILEIKMSATVNHQLRKNLNQKVQNIIV